MSSIDKNSFLFQAENISISYKTKRGLLKAVQGASFPSEREKPWVS